MVSEPELPTLLSGLGGGSIDVDDWRAHTRSSGGYFSSDSSIKRFWEVRAGWRGGGGGGGGSCARAQECLVM